MAPRRNRDHRQRMVGCAFSAHASSSSPCRNQCRVWSRKPAARAASPVGSMRPSKTGSRWPARSMSGSSRTVSSPRRSTASERRVTGARGVPAAADDAGSSAETAGPIGAAWRESEELSGPLRWPASSRRGAGAAGACSGGGVGRKAAPRVIDTVGVEPGGAVGRAGAAMGDAALRLGDAALRLGDAALRLGDAALRLGDAALRLGDADGGAGSFEERDAASSDAAAGLRVAVLPEASRAPFAAAEGDATERGCLEGCTSDGNTAAGPGGRPVAAPPRGARATRDVCPTAVGRGGKAVRWDVVGRAAVSRVVPETSCRAGSEPDPTEGRDGDVAAGRRVCVDVSCDGA